MKKTIALTSLAVTMACTGHRESYARRAPKALATPSRDYQLPEVAIVEADSDAPMIIRTGTVSIEVDSVDHAVDQVRALAKSFGGYIGSSSIQRGTETPRTATLMIDVPEERLDGVLGQLTPIGRVETVNMTARDVGEEYVDFGARVANSKREEQQLLTLLATRTGKLKDVLDVEQELASVRGDIEHAEGHLRYLKAHSAMSTIDVTVHEHATVLAEAPGQHPIREAVGLAWHNCVGFVAACIASLGVLLPLALLAGGAWVLGRRVLRRRVV